VYISFPDRIPFANVPRDYLFKGLSGFPAPALAINLLILVFFFGGIRLLRQNGGLGGNGN
jgi:hypothetical protein